MAIFKTALETFSATSNADTNIQNGLLQISNPATGAPFPPAIFRGVVKGIEIDKSLAETSTVMRISWTAANSTTYAFRLVAPNGYTYYNFYFVSDASATDAEIGNAIQAWVATTGIATGTYSSGAYIDLTAVAGSPMFGVQTISNITAALQMPTIAPHATPGTALAGTTTVTVTTLAAQSFKTGETVTITGATGFTFTNALGVSSVASVTARITYVSATTFTLDGITGSGTNTGTIVITKVPQVAFGTPAQVTSEVGVSGYTANSSYNYDKMIVKTMDGSEYHFWLMASTIASAYTPTANLTVFYGDIATFQSTAFIPTIWGAPTGTISRAALTATASATYTQSELTAVIQALKAVITDIRGLQQKVNSLPLS